MAKIKIDEKYVRCKFCDSSWFIYTLEDSNNLYKETNTMLQQVVFKQVENLIQIGKIYQTI